jgi:hypothetical protein
MGQDVARRPDDRRKRKREEKKAKKAELRAAAELELKRLKNLKRAEIDKKLAAVHEVAGLKGAAEGGAFDAADIDGDFDPDAWDKKMESMFGDEFYGDEEAAAADGDKLQDSQAVAAVSRAAGVKDLDARADARLADERVLQNAVVADTSEGKKKRKRKKKSAVKEALEADTDVAEPAEMEELYALDFEDIIDGIKTRFSYAKVGPGLGRIVALRHRSPTLCQIRKHIRCLLCLKRQCDRTLGRAELVRDGGGRHPKQRRQGPEPQGLAEEDGDLPHRRREVRAPRWRRRCQAWRRRCQKPPKMRDPTCG